MGSFEIHRFIERWIDGDESAFRSVVDYYHHQMYSFAFQMIQNNEDAEELVMNAFLKLWQYKHRIAYISRPDEYLFGILRREVVGHARKRTISIEPIEAIALSDLGVVPHPELALQEIREKYQTALNKLSPRQRTIFQMSREQEMTQKEIATETGLSVNTVGNHMNAALKVFREEMKEYPEALLLLVLSSTAGPLLLG